MQSQIYSDDVEQLLYDRVDKNDAPLLVIGLGGAGADAVRTIKKTFSERFKLHPTEDGKHLPHNTRYLVFDTDSYSSNGFDKDEFVNIAWGVNITHLSPSQKRWVHRDLHLTPPFDFGSGAYRAVARLMLDENSDLVFRSIEDALTKACVRFWGTVQIVVITSIGGGTGSGTFMDVGQIIRYVIENTPRLQRLPYDLTCYMIMPDISIKRVMESGGPATMIDILRHNSYAALKELDFWMDYERHHTQYEMEYANGKRVIWQKPFDYVNLLCGSDIRGQTYQDSYNLAQQTIAESLLHFYAPEANNPWFWTYISYQRSLASGLHTSYDRMRLPLNYVYRAIGSYSKRIPKKKILFYEGMLLYKTFMPPRNEYGKLVPNDKLLRDGKAIQRFGQVAMKTFPLLYQDFVKTVPFPQTFQNFSAKNNTLVEDMRLLNPPAHQKFSQWQLNSVAPVAREFAENYRKAVWDNFAKLCKSIMSDPELGPYSLLQYLKDDSVSLRVAFRNYAASAQSVCNNLYGSIGQAQQVCVNTYQNFLKPPLLGGEKAVQTYLSALRDLLDTVRQYELAKQYAYVMEMTSRSIDAYIENALEPLCDLLEELEADFGNPEYIADSLSSDLFDVSTLHQNIQDTFAAANAEGTVSRSFLGKLCESTFEFEPNVDTGSCGMTFLFKLDGRIKALQLMKSEMDVCFKNINSMSLESILQLQCYDPDPGVQTEKQQKYITNLTNSVVDSAIPLFSIIQNSSNISTNAAKCLYFSVPNDAPSVLGHLNPITVQGMSMIPKDSPQTDHIYCSLTWGVLPLYSYDPMESLKKAYEAVVNTPNHPSAPALHLVWTGAPDADYRENWTRLPDPAPYYLFGADTDSQREKKEYESARNLVMRALDSGMLTVNSSVADPVMHPTYTFRVFRDAHVAQHNAVIQRKLTELLGRKDPVTGAPLSPDAMLELLHGFVATAEPVKHSADKSPTVMNTIVGINENLYKINPFDPTVTGNPELYDQAKANYHKLTIAYAVHILLQTPALLTDAMSQIDSFEMIAEAIAVLEDVIKVWKARIAYTEIFVRLYAFGFIDFENAFDFSSIFSISEVAPLIQLSAFRNDIQDRYKIIKAVCAASDLTARQALEKKLGIAEKAWTDQKLNGVLTKEAIDKQIARLTDLLSETTAERKACVSEKQTNSKADHALLDKYIALLDGVIKYASKRIEDLKKTLSKLGSAPAAPAEAPVESAKAAPAAGTWNCACGMTGIKGKFCPECGNRKPSAENANIPPASSWICPDCGRTGLTGKFCYDCGRKRPV